jgi:hypothetical protein
MHREGKVPHDALLQQRVLKQVRATAAWEPRLQFEPKEFRDSSSWAKHLRLDDLSRDENMAKKKLKRYYGKPGLSNEVDSIHVPQHGLGASFYRRFESNQICTRLPFLLKISWTTTFWVVR